MKIELLKKLYEDNHLPVASFVYAKEVMLDFDAYLKDGNPSFDMDELTIEMLDQWIETLVNQQRNTVEAFRVMMRYFRVTKQHHLFVRLTQYTGALDVIDSIYHRMEKFIGTEETKKIKEAFPIPVLGTNILELNRFTEQLMNRMKESCSDETLRKILNDNHHQIPRDSFNQERIYYETAPSIKAYLKDLHQRKIQELTTFYEQDRVWYEQIITPDVIEFVKSNPEIMSAVYRDDALYITKIPYDTQQYIQSTTDQLRAYHACHCPFAKASILEKGIKIDAQWCYCSAGFTKLPFEVALGTELPIECISSALKGDPLCRFKIDLTGITHK